MTVRIKHNDVVESVARALQYISYYHPPDFIRALADAYEKETGRAAKNALAQILINSKMAALGKRPMCQDTGIVNIFVEVGSAVSLDFQSSLAEIINEGVRLAYQNPENPLRASIVDDPIFSRKNTADNTPAVVHTKIVRGDKMRFIIAAKGSGSENKARFAVLSPDDNLCDWVLRSVPKMGAGWCPPGILGIGVGGTSELAMLLAKEALMEKIDIHHIRQKTKRSNIETLRLELVDKINALGIGAQGLGGLTTVLDVKIKDYPTHAASKPVAMIPNCAATRHIDFTLDGRGVAKLPAADLDIYPDLKMDYSHYRKINLDTLRPADVRDFKIGETLLLSGTILTARDAAHKRLEALIKRGEPLPAGVNFRHKLIYYVGPVRATGSEIIGPAGPTTATRMDKFSETMLAHTEILGMIGKAERGAQTVKSIRRHRAVYLIAVGGAAYLISKSIRAAKVLAFEDLGMEAIYELKVENMPVAVAVDSAGNNIHQIFQNLQTR